MTRRVVFRRAARRELEEAALWYEERRSGLGAEFTAEVERSIELLAEHPQRLPVMHREVRCARVRRFPYSVFFRVESMRIVVLAVFHARRNPAVWRRRV